MVRHPKYHHVYQLLRQRILSGSYSSGKLPSLAALTQEYAVSLGTINRAVKLLETESLVNCRSGRGGTRINKIFQQREKELFGERRNPWQDFRFFLESKITLRCQMSVNTSFEHDLFARIQAGFQQQYPWIDLILQDREFVQDSEHQADRYDLCMLSSNELSRHIQSGAALDLSPCWEAFGCPPLSIPGYSGLLGSAADFAIPFTFNTPLFYYHSPLLESVPETFEDFSALVLALQKKHCPFSSNLGLISLLHYYIGKVPEQIHKPGNRDRLAEALQFWKCCYYQPTEWNNFEPAQSSKAFAEGKIAFLLSYYLNAGRTETRKIAWQAAAMPGQQDALLIMVMCIVSSKSHHPKEAWLFARYLLSKEVQDLICQSFHAPPALEESFQGAFRKYSPAEYKALLKIRRKMTLDNVGTFSKSAVYQQTYHWLKGYFQQQFNLDQLVDQLQGNLAQLFHLDRIFDSHLCKKPDPLP